MLTSLFSVLQLASRLPVGLAYRAERARRQYALALAAMGISTMGFALAGGHPVAVVALTALHGFAFGSIGTLGLALIIDVTQGARAGASMAAYTAAISTGYALGSLIGGALAESIGITAALGAIGVLPILAAGAVLALPPITGAPLVADRGAGLRGLLAAGARLDARVWLAFATVLYLNILQDSVDTFFPVYAPTVGISLALVGVLRAFKSGSAMFIRVTGALVLGAVHHRRMTLIAVVAAAAATVAIPLSTSVAALIPVWIVLGLTRGILRATSAAEIADLRREGRDVGLASGVYNAGLDVGGILGPAVGGVVAGAVGIPLMFQMVAVAALAAWLSVALVTRRAVALARAGAA